MPPWERYQSAAPALAPWERYSDQTDAPPAQRQPAPALPRRTPAQAFNAHHADIARRQTDISAELPGAEANALSIIPFNAEMTGHIAGMGAAANDVLRANGRGARDYWQAYRRTVDPIRSARTSFAQRRPFATGAIQGVSGLPLAAVAAPESIANVAAQSSRGLPLLMRQMAEGGVTGAGFGFAGGAGNSEGDVSQRLEAGNESAGVGAAFGMAAPVAVNALGAATDMLAPAVRGMFGRGPRGAPPSAPAPAPDAPPGGGSPPGSEALLGPTQGPRLPAQGFMANPDRVNIENRFGGHQPVEIQTGDDWQALVNQGGGERTEIPLQDLLSTQASVARNYLDIAASHPAERLPQIVEENGKYYIHDGHHRLTNTWDNGAETAPVSLFRSNWRPPGTPEATAPPREIALAADGSALPVRPAEPFRQSHVGGSEDLRAASGPQPPGPELQMQAGDGALPRRSPQMGDNAGVRQEQMQGATSPQRGVGAERGATSFSDPRLKPQENKAVEMARNNYTNAEIADEMELSVSRVNSLLVQARSKGVDVPMSGQGVMRGINKRTMEPTATTEQLVRAREQLRRSGQTSGVHGALAERYGLSRDNVAQRLYQYDRGQARQQQSAIPRQYPQMPAKPQPQFGMTFAPPNGQFYSNPIPLPRRTGGGSRPPLRNVTPPGPPRLPRDVVNTVDRLASRRRMSASDVERAIGQGQQNPQGRVLADVFDDPGVRTLRSIAQRPGETGQRAAERASERFHAAPVRILKELERRIGVGETRQAAMDALSARYKEVSANIYRPLFEQPSTAEQKMALGAAVERIQRAPLTRSAIARANTLFNSEREAGLVTGDLTENAARYAHYVKLALDDMISSRTRTGGLTGNALRTTMELKSQLLRAMDETIPGYRDARAQWGGLKEAEDALDQGAHFLSMSADEVRASMTDMTPFAQYHARIGLAHELHQRLGLRGSVNGNRNVAEVLGSPEMQARVSAVFDSPEQAAHFLDTLNTQNKLMRNAGQWGTGSQTYSNITHGDDQNTRALMEAGGHAASGNPVAAIGRLGRRAVDAALGHRMEQSDNRVGEALLHPVDEGQKAKEFAAQVIDELKRLEARRNINTSTSRVAAAAAGAQTGRNKRP